jgi:hypothetical protein
MFEELRDFIRKETESLTAQDSKELLLEKRQMARRFRTQLEKSRNRLLHSGLDSFSLDAHERKRCAITASGCRLSK